MVDVYSKTVRSRVMRSVKAKDTRPELVVRSCVHKLGYRFRLHRTDLPGHPDLVFSSRRKIILVHGCFWHRHRCRRGRSLPVANRAYWQDKFTRNVARDKQVLRELRKLGWKALVVWECETIDRKSQRLIARVRKFLG